MSGQQHAAARKQRIRRAAADFMTRRAGHVRQPRGPLADRNERLFWTPEIARTWLRKHRKSRSVRTIRQVEEVIAECELRWPDASWDRLTPPEHMLAKARSLVSQSIRCRVPSKGDGR